jgi:phosphonate transport system substrate-binding protein
LNKLFLYIVLIMGIIVEVKAAQKFTISVVPQMQSMEIQQTWAPFLKKLTERTGFEFELRHYKTIPLFEKALSEGEPDIAFMNPYHAVMAYEWEKYEPVIHDKKGLVGILVVKEGGNIKQLSDLNGENIAFPAPNAFAASLYMRALLEKRERIKFKPVYVKTHTNVYRNVMFSLMPAGGGVNNTFNREEPEVRQQLKVLYTTQPTAPHPLCVHPRVGKKSILIIQQAILDIGKNSINKKMLDDIQIPTPVMADYTSEYLPLKKLKIEDYVVSEY